MKKNTWAKIAIGVVAGIVTLGAVVAISRSADEDKSKVLNGWAYETCRLDDVTGKRDVDDKSGISTKDFYELEQLESIKRTDDDESIEYYVYMYDEAQINMDMILKTDEFTTEEIEAAVEMGAVYFKVEIVDTNDDEISFFEKFGLSDKVEVTLKTAEE